MDQDQDGERIMSYTLQKYINKSNTQVMPPGSQAPKYKPAIST